VPPGDLLTPHFPLAGRTQGGSGPPSASAHLIRKGRKMTSRLDTFDLVAADVFAVQAINGFDTFRAVAKRPLKPKFMLVGMHTFSACIRNEAKSKQSLKDFVTHDGNHYIAGVPLILTKGEYDTALLAVY